MQPMCGKVLRLPRLRPTCEVRRRTNDGHPHVRPNTHGDHVLCDLFAEPHTRVIALCNDVGEPVVDNDFDVDVRVVGKKLRQCGLRGRLRPRARPP